MIHALASGTLWEDPERRQSKAGKPFVLASIKVDVGQETRTLKVLAFSDHVQDELMTLHHGDALSVVGQLKAEIWEPENRGARISMTIFAESVLPLRAMPKERGKNVPPAAQLEQPPNNRTKQQRCAGTWTPEGGPNDAIPF